MMTSQKYFLLVAEEMNMAYVAKKNFISPQCVSNHIKQLENHYGVKLFTRKPRLKLTEAGEVVARTLRHIQLIENNLDNELHDIDSGDGASLRIGLHTSRANVLLPQLLPTFRLAYPKLVLSIYSNVAREMEKMLLKGQLDLMLANHPASANGISSVLLLEEPVFLVASDGVLKKYLPNKYPECKESFVQGVDIETFRHVPFVMNLETSNMRFFVDNLFAEKGIKPLTALQTNINEMHYEFSAMDFGVSFCGGMMLSMQRETFRQRRLNIFPILNYDKKNKIVLAFPDKVYIPRYMQDFIDIVREFFGNLTMDVT